MTHKAIIPPGQEILSERFHFSPAIKAGDTIYCSGTIGRESDGTIPSDPERQFVLAFEALGEVLRAAGADFSDIVEITSFHTDHPATLRLFASVRDRYCRAPWPAWTAIGVSALGTAPGTLFEVKATAVKKS